MAHPCLQNDFFAAREARDELDLGGVRLREAEWRAKRALTFTALPDGMSRLVWVMDPETAATVKDVFDRLTSPKRGGVRFVAEGERSKSDRILGDTRTVGQLASDGFEQLLRAGADLDSGRMLGSGGPVVRITATRTALTTRRGLGRIDGQPAPVSIETVERLTCTGATEDVIFDPAGRALDVGREQRTFTRRQREALAVRDGGCMMPGCERPPSWCEAHHIRFWGRDNGHTNTADGTNRKYDRDREVCVKTSCRIQAVRLVGVRIPSIARTVRAEWSTNQQAGDTSPSRADGHEVLARPRPG
jgi:hypothetical protein